MQPQRTIISPLYIRVRVVETAGKPPRKRYPLRKWVIISDYVVERGGDQSVAKNVFGQDLQICSSNPLTGFFRTGKCETCGEDQGMHTVCTQVTAEFLEFSYRAGNDLSTPRPEYRFPGLQPGDHWCLCLPRWLEALEAGVAPKLALKATHISAIEHVSMETLLKFALDADDYIPESPAWDDDPESV